MNAEFAIPPQFFFGIFIGTQDIDIKGNKGLYIKAPFPSQTL